MARAIGYRFVGFPFHDAAGRETLKSGSIVAIAPSVPGDSLDHWRAARIVLDGMPDICPGCRAKVVAWLHEVSKHDLSIQKALSDYARTV
jgi:hypothetical protein